MAKSLINCRLCLTTESNLFNIFDEENLSKNIAAILNQHFWFQVQEQDVNKYICEICWLQVNNFHSFYIKVKKQHEELQLKLDTIKIEMSTSVTEVTNQINLKETNSYDSHQIENDDNTSDDNYTYPKSVLKKSKTTTNRKGISVDRVKTEQENQRIEEYFPMECDICTTSCNNFQSIQLHYRQEHKMRWYLRCCKRKFLKRCSLLDHIQWHLNPEIFKCDICNKAYADKRGLIDHQARHLSTDEKPFKCTECPKTYTKRFILEEHLSKHKSTKKFDCDDCGKLFSI